MCSENISRAEGETKETTIAAEKQAMRSVETQAETRAKLAAATQTEMERSVVVETQTDLLLRAEQKDATTQMAMSGSIVVATQTDSLTQADLPLRDDQVKEPSGGTEQSRHPESGYESAGSSTRAYKKQSPERRYPMRSLSGKTPRCWHREAQNGDRR